MLPRPKRPGQLKPRNKHTTPPWYWRPRSPEEVTLRLEESTQSVALKHPLDLWLAKDESQPYDNEPDAKVLLPMLSHGSAADAHLDLDQDQEHGNLDETLIKLQQSCERAQILRYLRLRKSTSFGKAICAPRRQKKRIQIVQ